MRDTSLSKIQHVAIRVLTSARCPIALLLIATAGGCMVGPNYKTPETPMPEQWLHASPDENVDPDVNARWWTHFNDPTLNRLIEQAFAQNLTLRQAGLRVLRARAERGIAVGEFFPQTQKAVGDLSANRVSENSPQGQGDRSYKDLSVGLEAAWELDFWGKFRRGIESADAALDATVADYDDVMVLLAADVASSYVTIRSLQEQIGFTTSNTQSLKDTFDLTEVRFDAGAVSELDVSTAQETLANTRALIPSLEDALRRTEMALCVLLGRLPSDLVNELGPSSGVPTAPTTIAVGIPAELLRRRPDVRRAERTAAALSAQIGVATADFFPSIAIAGATGFHTSTYQSPLRSPDLDDLFDSQSFQGFIGLSIDWPILNYGRITNNVRSADARFQEAAAAYQNTVLQAAAEVETGLSSFLRSRERATLLESSVLAAKRTVELSLIQYRQGAADFLRVNQAQVALVERQNSLVVAKENVAQGAIATYRALGGGWEPRLGLEFVPRTTVEEMKRRTDWGDMIAPGFDPESDFRSDRSPLTNETPASMTPAQQEETHVAPQ